MADLEQKGAEVERQQEQPQNPLLALVKLQQMLAQRPDHEAAGKEMCALYESLIPALKAKVQSMLPEVNGDAFAKPIEPTIERIDDYSLSGGRLRVSPPTASSRVGFDISWISPGGFAQALDLEEFTNLANLIAALYGLQPDEYKVSDIGSSRYARAITSAGVDKAGNGCFLNDCVTNPRLSVGMPISALLDGVPEGKQALCQYQVLAEEQAALEQRLEDVRNGPNGISKLRIKFDTELKNLIIAVLPVIERDGVTFKPSPRGMILPTADPIHPDEKLRLDLFYVNDSEKQPRVIDSLTTEEFNLLAERIALLHGSDVKAEPVENKTVGNLQYRKSLTNESDGSPGNVLLQALVESDFLTPLVPSKTETIRCYVPFGALERQDSIQVELRRGACAAAAKEVTEGQ